MTVSVMGNGFSFNFNGRQYNYSYERIRERVRKVERENPNATMGEQLGKIAGEFADDYAAGVGISKDKELVKGICGIILSYLIQWFSDFINNAIDKAIRAGKALFAMMEYFFGWLLGIFD